MPLMLENIYDALKDAGASEEKARKASIELAGYDNRLTSLEVKMNIIIGFNSMLLALVIGLYFQ